MSSGKPGLVECRALLSRSAPIAAVMLTLSVSLVAQRHGRPDSAQNYAKAIPEPTLEVTIDGQTARWKPKDLAAMTRRSAAVRGKRASTRTYGGVPLAELVPQGHASRAVDVYEIHHGFFHTRRLYAFDLEPGSEVLVADQRDKKRIDKASLFYVVARTRDHKPVVIGKVTSIVLHPNQG